MASIFTLGVIVRVIDKFTGPFRSFRALLAGHRDQLRQLGQDMKAWGKGALVAGAVAGAALAAPVAAFASLETASTQLRTTLMDNRGGLPAAFGALLDKATDLGNRLPGTTEDFIRMMSIMGAKGISADTMLGGLLEAAGLLGVVLKPLGVTYEQTAESVAVFSKALGIASQDMVPFTDLIQRAAFLGVDIGDLTYAIARSAPSLKVLGIQGLAASKDLVPLIAMLNDVGIRGELAGTNIKNVLDELSNPQKVAKISAMLAGVGIQFNTLDAGGKFLGIRHMIAELGKLTALNPAQFATIIEMISGGGGDASVLKTLITGGLKGYEDVVARMRGQADLQMKVNESLGTFANVLDAATGTFKNTMAEFGKIIAPELKSLVTWLGEMAAATQAWMKEHPRLTKWLGILLGVSAGLLVVFGGLAVAIGTVIAAIGGSAIAIGVGVIAGLAAIVAALVVWWDDLADAVKRFWEALKGGFGIFNAFAKGWAWLTGRPRMEIDYSNLAPDFADIRPGDRGRDYGGVLAGAGRGTSVSIGNLNLPNVKNSRDFLFEMEALAGGMVPAQATP